jgi:hypothetical protein
MSENIDDLSPEEFEASWEKHRTSENFDDPNLGFGPEKLEVEWEKHVVHEDLNVPSPEELEALWGKYLAFWERLYGSPLSREDLLDLLKFVWIGGTIDSVRLRCAHERLAEAGLIPALPKLVVFKGRAFHWGGGNFHPDDLAKPLGPAEVKKSLRKGLNYKKTRTPDLVKDRRILKWLAANPRRSWAQADREFNYAAPYGKKCYDRIDKHYEDGCYDDDPELMALYRKVKSQRERGRKKKYPSD